MSSIGSRFLRRRLHSARFARRAVRSGLRRYPRALLESLFHHALPRLAPLDSCLDEIERHSFAAAWLGHAGVLVRLGSTTLLVDPALSDRIGLRLGGVTFGLRRLSAAPASPERLPRAALLLIPHAHFDHLDKPTLRRLANPRTVVVVPRGARRLIPRGFGEVIEAGAGERLRFGDLEAQVARPAHWGARYVLDRRRQFNSYYLESPAGRVFFAGDTAFTRAFSSLPEVDLAVFGIGAYDPWERMHATPEQVWAMACSLGARWLLPVHHSTFELGDEPLHEPMRRLLAAADGQGHRILQLPPGEIWKATTA